MPILPVFNLQLLKGFTWELLSLPSPVCSLRCRQRPAGSCRRTAARRRSPPGAPRRHERRRVEPRRVPTHRPAAVRQGHSAPHRTTESRSHRAAHRRCVCFETSKRTCRPVALGGWRYPVAWPMSAPNWIVWPPLKTPDGAPPVRPGRPRHSPETGAAAPRSGHRRAGDLNGPRPAGPGMDAQGTMAG